MKRVLVFGITDNPGGIESVIMNYYRCINKKNIQFDFLCNTKKVAYEDEIKKLGGTIYRITARSVDRIKFKKELNAFFKENSYKYDSIWVNVCSLANIDYLKLAKKYNIEKRIIHSHNSQNMDSFIRGVFHKINRLVLKKYATDFWSCSDDASKWFYNNSIINSPKYMLINNAVDYQKYKFNKNIRNEYRRILGLEGKMVIGNVGRMHFQKNQKFILEIFNEMYKENHKTVLLLIGDGPDRKKIEEMVDEYGLNNNVIFLGVRNDIPELLQAMDVFLFPSLFEGLPLALIEAQVSNLPIYTSKGKINNRVVVDKNLVHFISLEDNEKIWAREIFQTYKNSNREFNNQELIRKSGYDIKTETKKLEKMLLKEGYDEE